VSSSTIGIKVADGSFYPIVERESGGWKKLILTTVKDDQTNVQIDLYESETENIETATYVGSLLIEDIASAPAGEAEIELRLGMDADGKFSARAEDMGSGESQSLNVSLESLTGENIYDTPEFELGDDFDSFETTDTFSDEFADDSGGETFDDIEDAFDMDEEGTEPAGGFDEGLEEEEEEGEEPAYIPPPKRKPFLLALFILFGIAAVAALTIFLYRIFEGPSAPPLEARGGGRVVEAEVIEEADEIPAEDTAQPDDREALSESTAAETARDGPVAAEPADVSPPASDPEIGGVWYWIRWGDTLWDISSSFYRTPWRYGKIAEENSIRNPDLIFAGTKIYIPEKK
jgi:hypothetical protein